MKKRGFTLIELLAVIVILAVIAIIATPIILNMISRAKKSAAKASAYGYFEAIDNNNGFADAEIAEYTKITDGEYNVSEISVKMKGQAPTSGEVTIESGKVKAAEICINGYTVTYEKGKEATVGSKCGGSSSVSYKAYSLGEEVLYDPKENKPCTTGTTCYKWNVITTDDTTSKDKVTLQMDHNIKNISVWATKADYANNTAYGTNGKSNKGPITVLKDLETATSGWDDSLLLNYTYDTSAATNNYGTLSCVNGACTVAGSTITSNLKARIITAEEIAEMTVAAGAGNNTTAANWTIQSTLDDYYYFSRSTIVLGTATEGTGSTALSWLLSNTTASTLSGATNNSYGTSNNGGYWTLTPVSNDATQVWSIGASPYEPWNGNIGYYYVKTNDLYGIRPVITVSKSKL